MFSHLSHSLHIHPSIKIDNQKLSFQQYIAYCQELITERRKDIAHSKQGSLILEANSPFELYPEKEQTKTKVGALLIHGLLDSPFSLRDIGMCLQNQGILSKAILLPGHGTSPKDLLDVHYDDWIQAVRFGIRALRAEVDRIFLIGYSTGAALSIHEALNDDTIAGIILLAPAIRIKAPVDVVVGWHRIMKVISKKRKWLYIEDENDYAKYQSIAFNPVTQVSHLTHIIFDLAKKKEMKCPVFVAVSREDETISSHSALDFFMTTTNPANEMLLYTSCDHAYPDARIITRNSCSRNMHINHFSHVSIPFSPDNKHYGQTGDYMYASHLKNPNCIYGAYNRIEVNFHDLLYKLALIKNRRRTLTYNPDFDFMSKKIIEFIHEHE